MMKKLRLGRAGIGTLGLIALGVLFASAPAGASAADCTLGMRGGGPSGWETSDQTGEFEDALLLAGGGGAVVRNDAFDDYGQPEINGTGYQAPTSTGCSYQDRRQELAYPSVTVGGVVVTPKLYADPRASFGRQYVSLRNPGAAPVTVDFGWNGDLGSDSDTVVDRTSSGDALADPADRWAVSCDDGDTDGCADTAGEADRDPELAHNWESQSGKQDSADAVDLVAGDGNFDVTFTGVTIQPGQTVAYMQIVTLASTVKAARSAVKSADKKPGKYGAFRALTKKEIKRLRNW